MGQELLAEEKEIVMNATSEYEARINQYIEYLKKMYIDGNLVMLDITDEIEAEHMEYARNLGIQECDAEDIYNKFLEENKIEEKNDILFAMLLSYGRNGTFSEEEIRKATVDMDEFWGKEYVKFRNAVDELFRLQNSLCEESESDVLNEADCEVLHEKAKSLGFYNKDYIAAVIRGNGIRRKQ